MSRIEKHSEIYEKDGHLWVPYTGPANKTGYRRLSDGCVLFKSEFDGERISVDKGLTNGHSRLELLGMMGRNLHPDCCACMQDAFKEQIWPDEINKSPSWTSDDDVTQDTQQWVDAVMQMQDPVYDEYANIPDLQGLNVKQDIVDKLTDSQGWSLSDIESKISSQFGNQMKDQQIQTIARTETAAVLNGANVNAIEARPDDPDVRWVGPDDGDQTELCNDLSKDTEDGVPYSEFQQMMQEYAKQYEAGKTDRVDQGILHYQERYTVELMPYEIDDAF